MILPASKLNLGCGSRPSVGAVNHDRTRHSPWVDMAWDLNVVPWPWDDDQWESIEAYDVMEHLNLEVNQWLDECWRILRPSGTLTIRVPAFDNHLSYRDPTHKKVFHPESFNYWDPSEHLWQDFGRYYWDEDKWWSVEYVGRDSDDLKFVLTKLITTS